MPVTRQELDSFHQFAAAQLGQADPPGSLQECLDQWRRAREYEETVADVRRSEAEFAAGLGIPADDAIAQVRQELGLQGDQ